MTENPTSIDELWRAVQGLEAQMADLTQRVVALVAAAPDLEPEPPPDRCR